MHLSKSLGTIEVDSLFVETRTWFFTSTELFIEIFEVIFWDHLSDRDEELT